MPLDFANCLPLKEKLFAVPDEETADEKMKYTMYNLWSLLREAVQQVQEERKESSNLRGQVAQLESEVLACHQIISQLLIRVWNFIFVF